MESPIVTDRMIRKFATRVDLDDDDRAAIAAIPTKVRTVESSSYIMREGQPPLRCTFLIDGFAYRQKLTPNGEREIVSLLIPGEFIDLQNLFLNESDHDIQALTRITIAEMPRLALRELASARPAIARSLWIDALVEASIHREWLLSIGRRNARTRLAHLICEFAARLHGHAMTTGFGYELPMTQEQLGDALGLTPVHVNRVLKSLETDGLILRRKRYLNVLDWPRLRDAGEFNDRYLHLNLIRPPAAG